MKEHWTMFKRFVAMLLAVVITLSCAPLDAFAVTSERSHDPHVSLGVLIKQNVDGLSDEEAEIITSGALKADKTYQYQMPGDADDLISVNEETGTVTAKVYTDPVYGTVWIPQSFTLTDGQSAIAGYKDLALAEKAGKYEGTYEMVTNNPGNSFSVEVKYSLDLTLSDEDMDAQQKMLDAPYALAQDIATLKYLNAVGVIGDDQELANQIIDLSGGLIKDPTKIYANTILEFLGMNLDQLDNQSAIDIIYQLVEGIPVPVVEKIDFETGDMTMDELVLDLSKDGREAITNLYEQKNGNGLALVAFLEKYRNASYLEMLVKYGAELETALTSNYNDIDYLANDSRGLEDVSDEIADLLEDYTDLKVDVYDALNEKLEPMGYTVNSVKELQDVITALEAADDEAYDLIDETLQGLDADTKQQLEAMGIELPEKVTNADELDQLKVAMVKAYTDALTQVNSTLAGLDQEVKDQLQAAGAPAQITIADTSSYEAFVNSGDQDVQDLTALENALVKVRDDALAEADEKLQSIYTEYADWKSDLVALGAPQKIEAAADLTALQNALTTFKANMLGEADAKLQEIYGNAELKEMLLAKGAPAAITESAHLNSLQTALTAVKTDLLSAADVKLQTIYGNAELKAKLQEKGAPAAITEPAHLNSLQTALTAVKIDLLTTADATLQAIYEDSANAELADALREKGAPEKIETIDDLKKLQTAVSKVKEEMLKAANDLQNSLYNYSDALKEQLQNKGAQATIIEGADLTALKNALHAVYDAALTKADAELKNSSLSSLAPIKDINSKEDIEDLLDYIDGLDSFWQNMVADIKTELTTAKAALDQMDTAIAAVAVLETAVLAIEEAEAGLNTAATAVDALDGAQETLTDAINGIETMETAQASLSAANEGAQMLDGALDTLNVAVEAVDLLNEVLKTLGQVKTAVTSVKPYIGKVLEAQELIAQLNNTYLPLAKKVEEGLIQLEDGLVEMNAKKLQFDMLIMVMQVFCDTVKPVNDAFVNGTWNAPALVNADADPDYADLTSLADGLDQSTHTAVNPMHVTETVVHYQVDMYNVTVEYKATVVNPAKVDSAETIELATKTYTLTLKKNTTATEILEELALVADENAILSGWAISADNYVRSTTDLPALLTEDITYTISYAPKILTVSFGEGYETGTVPMQVPYGYRMTLPKLEGDSKNEYTYAVNDQKNLDQGTVVTITEDTAISREIGAISAKQYLTDLVVNTAPDMDPLVKNILQNQALNKGNAISIRVPGKDQVTVVSAPDAKSTTITALPYGSRVGDKNWIANTAIIDGVTVNLVDGVHVEITNPGFDAVVVNYELAITAAALGITDEQLLAVINTPYELVNDYKFQKATLDTLASEEIMNLMTMMNNQDFVIENPTKMTLKGALAKVESLNETLELGLGANAIAAANRLYNLIPDVGYVDLYYTLQSYNEQGMVHYYKNEQTYIAQITELNDILSMVVTDEGFLKLIPEQHMGKLQAIQKALGDAASLAEIEHKVNRELINVSSPYLNTLLTALEAAKAVELEKQITAPGELVWTATVEQPGPSKRTATMTVNFNGAEATASKNVGFGEILAYADLTAWAKELAVQLGLNDEIAAYYNVSYSFSGDVVAGQDVELTATWTLREFDVFIGSEKIGSVNYENRQITLVQHGDPNFQYRYYINNELYGAGTHTLTLAQFKALTEGNLVITRETVNMTEESLIKLVDSMNGATVLTKDANGQYAIVLRVDPATLETDMGNFAIGLFTTDYKYIGLDGSTFFDGKFHIQALIDAIMNSGIGTDSLLTLIDANGNITSNLTLGNDVEVLNTVKPAYMNRLGGVLLETSMGLGADAQNTTNAKFYITLAGGMAELAQIRNGLQQAKDYGMHFICKDGAIDVTATLPDQVYGAYLALLTMTDKADIRNLNDVDAQTVVGYLLGLVDPVVDDLTIETLTNMLSMAGYNYDLAAYEQYFDMIKPYVDPNKVTYEGDTAVLDIKNASINSVIGRLQAVVDGMELPAGMSIDLSKLIYEYDDPNTTADDETAGISATGHLNLTNLSTDYAALFVDVRANGMLNKFGLWTEEALIAGADGFSGASVIVLLDDITGNLNINTKTVLDLNGKTVTGNIHGGAAADVIIVDSDYKAFAHGTVNGTVSGNVTVLDGKYSGNVAAFLNDGYVQDENGVVSHKLYTITVDENNNHTVVLNATPDDIKGLATKENLTDLAIEIAASLVLNNLNAASLSVEGNQFLAVQLEDLIGLYLGENRMDTIIDTGLSWISAPDLAKLVNMIIDDLTDFAALETALQGDGLVASYSITTAPWEFEVAHVKDGNYLTVNVGTSDTKKETTLNVVVSGSLQEELAQLAGAMKDTVKIDVTVDMEDLVMDENSVINANGSVNGSVEVDFTEDPNYVIAMAVILADGADSKLKAELIVGIEDFYKTYDLYQLERVFKSLTAKQICDSIRSHSLDKKFDGMVDALALSAETKTAMLEEISNDELGYGNAVDVAAFALRQLKVRAMLTSVTESPRTLGSLEKTDENGKYFGFAQGKVSTGQYSVYGKYKLGYKLDMTNVAVKLRLFTDHKHTFEQIVDEKYLVSGATCTQLAVYSESCSTCGEAHPTATFTYGELLEHKYEQIVDEKYLVSGATCTEKAVYRESCSACGEAHPTATFTYGELLEHKYEQIVDEKYLVSGATCTELAVYKKSCSVCGEAHPTATFTYGELLEHKYEQIVDEKYLVSGATCTELAVYKKSCSACGEAHPTATFTYGELAEHNFGKWIDEVPADYTKDGVKGHKDCLICGKHFDKNDNEIADLTIPKLEGAVVMVTPDGEVVYISDDLLDAIENAEDGYKIILTEPVVMEDNLEISVKITIENAKDLDQNGYAIVLTDKNAAVIADSKLALVVSRVDGYRVDAENFTYTLDEVDCPNADEVIAGIDQYVDARTQDRYLILDQEPINGETLDQLRKSLTFKDLEDYNITMEIAGNDGTALVKTGDTMIVTAKNDDGHTVATITYTVVVLGDANCDGKALSNDALVMMKIYFGSITVNKAVMLAANANNDGSFESSIIGAADALGNMYKYFNWDSTYISVLK